MPSRSSAGGARGIAVVVVAERGEHDNLDGRAVGQDAAGRGDPVDAGHAQIHHHYVGREPVGAGDRLAAVARFADYGDVRLALTKHAKSGPDELLIVQRAAPESRGRAPRSRHPRSPGPRSPGPRSRHPRSRHPRSRAPRSRHPRSPGPRSRHPRSRHPRSRHPRSRHPRSRAPRSRHPRSPGPRSRHPRSPGPRSRHPRSRHPGIAGAGEDGADPPAAARGRAGRKNSRLLS
jgi:hypothetical protein